MEGVKMSMTKAKINKAIKHTGLELVGARGAGCFHFLDGDGNAVGESVMVCYLNQLTLGQWMIEAESARAL